VVGHLPQPRWVNLIIDGERIKLTGHAANALRAFDEDGTLSNLQADSLTRIFTRAGWAIRSHGRLRLTPAGLKVRDALRAYDERKQQALAQQETDRG
jgi:hypothetical protein